MNLAETLLPLLRTVADKLAGSPFAEDILTHVRSAEAIIARHETAKEAELVAFAVSLLSPQAVPPADQPAA